MFHFYRIGNKMNFLCFEFPPSKVDTDTSITKTKISNENAFLRY